MTKSIRTTAAERRQQYRDRLRSDYQQRCPWKWKLPQCRWVYFAVTNNWDWDTMENDRWLEAMKWIEEKDR